MSNPENRKSKLIVGVCAMESKGINFYLSCLNLARSKPMRNILDRLISTDEFEAIIFGDKVILDEPIEHWPYCDFLISFFSKGFPLEKAIEYVQLRQPFIVNDLMMQQVLLDRRLVLGVLDCIGVPTPERLETFNNDFPPLNDLVKKKLTGLGFKFQTQVSQVQQISPDCISVNGRLLEKPFVEKPVSGEDHNVHIYYSTNDGGGVRKLFRKIGNKSSSLCEETVNCRKEGSFVYEKFMESNNSEDVKVYTIGENFAHAETRKSPVVDGVVRRNAEGKEIRYVTSLTEEEKKIAKTIVKTFGQAICGFDLLRSNGKSYIIDVNGWSFVKGNAYYYDKCAEVLRSMFLEASKRKVRLSDLENQANENKWKLKGFFSVMRHADRTPKQKIKLLFKTDTFFQLLDGSQEEVAFKKSDGLQRVLTACQNAIKECVEDPISLMQLEAILTAKGSIPGTKVQIKPTFSKNDSSILEKVQCIVKWGGDFTHSGLHHSKDLAENLRKDLMIINKSLLDDVKVFTSSERRVIATADTFCRSFLSETELSPDFIKVAKEMLDDSNAAKDLMEQVKSQLKDILNPEVKVPVPKDIHIPALMTEPSSSLQELIEILSKLRVIMKSNWAALDVSTLQKRWCCMESPILFKERWEKLFKDFCDVERSLFDTSKISELHDSLKYDFLHNRVFIQAIFKSEESLLRMLFFKSETLFTCISPHEYGISNQEKLDIGITNSLHLLRQLIEEIQFSKESTKPCSRLFFTKESKITCLLNIVLLCGLKCNLRPVEIEELDYLTQINFEMYEQKGSSRSEAENEYSLRISFSPGAHDSNLIDLELDSKHALSVAPRVFISDHIPLNDALIYLAPKNVKLVNLSALKNVGSESEDGLFNNITAI